MKSNPCRIHKNCPHVVVNYYRLRGKEIFIFSRAVLTGSEPHTASYSMGRGFFHKDRATGTLS
jgi:hypothetical protein